MKIHLRGTSVDDTCNQATDRILWANYIRTDRALLKCLYFWAFIGQGSATLNASSPRQDELGYQLHARIGQINEPTDIIAVSQIDIYRDYDANRDALPQRYPTTNSAMVPFEFVIETSGLLGNTVNFRLSNMEDQAINTAANWSWVAGFEVTELPSDD